MDLIRQPILLDDDFNEIRRLFPSSLSVTLNSEPLSLANMTLPKGEEPLSTRQWVEVFGDHGSFGYFRVANDQTMYGQAQNVSLEHCLCTLRDNSTAPIIKATTEPGQKPPQEEQDAAKVKWTGTMRELLQHAIDCQKTVMWQLGEVPEIDGLEYEPKNANVLAVIMRILQLRNGLYLDTDLSTTPWTLNVREAESEPSCECRLTRNMESVEVEMNTNALYTRVVCPRLADGVIEDEEAMRKYGSITYFNNLSANVTRAEALEACKDFLNNHKKPVMSLNVSAQQLAKQTGEDLDSLQLNRLCRIALPEYGEVYQERIVSINYADLIKQPNRVDMTLSSPLFDAVAAIVELNQQSGGGGGGGGSGGGGGGNNQKDKEVETVKRTAEIEVNQKEGFIRMEATETDLSEAIRKINLAGININAPDAQIKLVASHSEVEAQGTRLTTAEQSINALNGEIALRVKKDELNSEIVLSGDGVSISGGTIKLDGSVLAKLIEGYLAYFDDISCNTIYVDGHANIGDANIGTVNGCEISEKTLTIGGKSCSFIAPSDATFELSDMPGYADALAVARIEGEQAGIASGAKSVWDNITTEHASLNFEDLGSNTYRITVSVSNPVTGATRNMVWIR